MLASAAVRLWGVAAAPRVTTTLALALCLLGCNSQPVAVLTGVDANACYAGGESGPTALLVVDPKYGTSFDGKPLMWPVGYTGRRLGDEVEVLNAAGTVVATTGRLYHISMGYVSSDGARQIIQSVGAFPAAANCGYPWDFIDCTAAPVDLYCLEGPTPPPYRPPVIVHPETPIDDPT